MGLVLKAGITSGYKKLYTLYFGRVEIEKAGLKAGAIVVLLRDVEGFSCQGTLNPNGTLSGMARVYGQANLQIGDEVVCEANASDQLIITEVVRVAEVSTSPSSNGSRPNAEQNSVFQRQRLRPIHIELFSPENLNRWVPENEPDVYMAFGVLQEYTRYRYCCATSKRLLDLLGFQADTKPDAVLVDDNTGEYVVAEFKMRSSAYCENHKPGDVDVLIVWEHDSDESDKLPPHVLSLREIAREAAQELIRTGE